MMVYAKTNSQLFEEQMKMPLEYAGTQLQGYVYIVLTLLLLLF